LRRLAPRSLRGALDGVTREVTPAGALASVQAHWEEVVGPTVAAEAEPVSESGGVVTVACRSSVWAQELELLGRDLRDRLNAAIGPPVASPAVRGLRFVVGFPRGS
jgi:predicted nucleic acid-binding Zn ribbon protein